MNNEGYVYHFFFKCKGKPAFTGTKSNKSVKYCFSVVFLFAKTFLPFIYVFKSVKQSMRFVLLIMSLSIFKSFFIYLIF